MSSAVYLRIMIIAQYMTTFLAEKADTFAARRSLWKI